MSEKDSSKDQEISIGDAGATWQGILEQLPLYDLTFTDEEKKAIQDSIKKTKKWFKSIDYGKKDSIQDILKEIELLEKRGYPNYLNDPINLQSYDLNKWVKASQDLLYLQKGQGYDSDKALDQITNNWSDVEKFAFLNWLKYYYEGNHLKYKKASNWYLGNDPGYILPVKPEVSHAQTPVDIDFSKSPSVDKVSDDGKREIIEKQRKKVIGRLDSLEKLIRSHEGQLFADNDFDALMESIYSLKKKINSLNKKTKTSSIFLDLIVRQGNVLTKRGYVNAGTALLIIAGETPAPTNTPVPQDSKPTEAKPAENKPAETKPAETKPAENKPASQNTAKPAAQPVSQQTVNPAINPPSAPAPTVPVGNPGSLPADTTGTVPPAPPPPASISASQSVGMKKFLEGLGKKNTDTSSARDYNSKSVLKIIETTKNASTEEPLIIIAQEAPSVPENPVVTESPTTTAPAAPTPTTNPSPEKTEIKVEESGFDAMIDKAFANLSIQDVVNKLEELSKIFKVREVPRQLATVDMMLDHLGLASFFPALAEATNKALESNNYISLRVEEVLSKLRGALETPSINLIEGEGASISTPETEQLKATLKSEEDKEKVRTQKKKEMRDMQLDQQTTSQETPEISIEEDLGTPAPVAPAPAPKAPAPVAPVTPPPPAR